MRVAGGATELKPSDDLCSLSSGYYYWMNAQAPINGWGFNAFCFLIRTPVRGDIWCLAFDANNNAMAIGKKIYNQSVVTWKVVTTF